MKIMKRYIAIAAILFGAMACQKESNIAQYDPSQIYVEASVKNTRVSGTTFEAGDRMSLYVVEYSGEEVSKLQVAGNYINNEPMRYDGAQWKGERPLFWSKTHCDFYAVYPYQQPESVTSYLFDITPDQSAPEVDGALSGYEASDLMWAKAEKIKPPYTTYTDDDGTVCTPPIAEDHYYPVQLQFKHMMSRVLVKIVRGPKYEGELPKDITVHLYNTVTTAEVDLTKGSLQRYAYGEKNTITMKRLAEDTFAAVVVPQNIERRTPLVEVTMDGIAYLMNYSISFRPGYQHTLTITLNTSPDQEKIEIEIEGDIEGWN
jgi:hypothetical protein